MASPSLLSLNKPLRDGSLQFQSHLNLVRSKAISSNRAYRLKPKYPTAAQYRGENYQETPHNFIVESARNCEVSTAWQPAPQLDLDLPETIGVSDSPYFPRVNGTSVTRLDWSICYDNRGVAFQPVAVTLEDVQGNNKAKYALVDITGVGSVEIRTRDRSGLFLNGSGDNPVF
jgi:ribosomal protein S13